MFAVFGNHRTIHKVKREEFDAVMLVLDKDEKGMFNDRISEAKVNMKINLSIKPFPKGMKQFAINTSWLTL